MTVGGRSLREAISRPRNPEKLEQLRAEQQEFLTLQSSSAAIDRGREAAR
jgi:hypothetical protein